MFDNNGFTICLNMSNVTIKWRKVKNVELIKMYTLGQSFNSFWHSALYTWWSGVVMQLLFSGNNMSLVMEIFWCFKNDIDGV